MHYSIAVTPPERLISLERDFISSNSDSFIMEIQKQTFPLSIVLYEGMLPSITDKLYSPIEFCVIEVSDITTF